MKHAITAQYAIKKKEKLRESAFTVIDNLTSVPVEAGYMQSIFRSCFCYGEVIVRRVPSVVVEVLHVDLHLILLVPR